MKPLLSRNQKVLFFLAALAITGSGIAQASIDSAQQLVIDTSNRVLERLHKERDQLKTNPALIYPLVQDIVLPNFDFTRMSQWVLGRYWRQASAEQRGRFTTEFRDLLVRTYAKALLDYSGQAIHYLPLNASEGATDLTVRTEIDQPGGPPIAINYRMYKKGEAWKVYDISVEGISLVTNYRSSFATEIRQGGLNKLIASLEDLNKKAQQGE